MGWSTDLFCNINFNKETYNNLYEVQEKIEDLQSYLNRCKKEIRDLAIMTEPEKFYNKEDYESAYAFIDTLLEENFDLIDEYTKELYKLHILEDNWDKCHNKNGLAINPPENINWDTAFLDGDFVKSVKRPNVSDTL